MNLHQVPPTKVLPTSSSKHQRRWQMVAQGVWIVLALVLLVTFVFNISTFYQSLLSTVCTLPTIGNCPTGQLTPGNVQALAHLHSTTAYASFLVALTGAVSLLFWVVGLLIFWRKSQEWMGLFVSLVCVIIGTSGGGEFFVTTQMPLLFQLLTNLTWIVLYPAITVFLFTFPTGRFTPRWTWAACVFICVLATLPSTVPPVASAVSALLFLLTPIGVQVYRYARVYDTVQRQQTKWVVLGLSVGLSFPLIFYVLGWAVPGSSAPDSWYLLLESPMWVLGWAFLVLSIGIAILRYRLWDIDVIINRTLVYGSLTILLAGLYIGLILALQALVRALTGSLSQQPLVLVASTLVIAALFQPLRQRLQVLIDRRFYRRKYDAAKVMAAFSATLRNEVDLDQLREQLLAVVEETMQPAHLSLWIRPVKQQAAGEGIRGESLLHGGELPSTDRSDSG
jgi:hypothetical protein